MHACWDLKSLKALEEHLDDHQCILPKAWPELTRKGTDAYDALETLIKGLEISLPADNEFLDKDGIPRHNIRARWWELAMVPADAIHQILTTPFPRT